MASEAVDLQPDHASAATSAGVLATAGIPVRLVDVDPPGWSVLRRGGRTDERVMVVVPADRADEARALLADPPPADENAPVESGSGGGADDPVGDPADHRDGDLADEGPDPDAHVPPFERRRMPAAARGAMFVAIVVMGVSLVGMIVGAILSIIP